MLIVIKRPQVTRTAGEPGARLKPTLFPLPAPTIRLEVKTKTRDDLIFAPDSGLRQHPSNDPAAMVSHHSGGPDNVYDFVCGPDERLAGAGSKHFVHAARPAHGRPDERAGGGDIFPD